MKLHTDKKEKKGFFGLGGKIYVLNLRLELTDEEMELLKESDLLGV